MESTYEKNRYLRLDSTPVEQGKMERHLPKGALSATFLIAAVAADGTPSLTGLFSAAALTAEGALMRYVTNRCSNRAWDNMDEHVIDTRPARGTQNNPPSHFYLRAGLSAGVHFLLPPFAWVSAAIFRPAHMSEYFISSLPTLMGGLEQVRTYHKIRTGQWKVIKMADMEPEPQKEKAPALVLGGTGA